MKKKFNTEQENFWSGEFGDSYNQRNAFTDQFLANQIYFFSKIVDKLSSVKSVIEFGANIGVNLRAIKYLLPKSELSAIEINKEAVKELKKWKEGKVKIYPESILDFKPDYKRDLVFTKGVLIHINPEKLKKVYDLLYKTSGRYICVAEYYNPSPVGIDYRNQKDKLFKRDFCGEIMGQFSDLKLIDYGFSYHHDPMFPQDDITWFLLEKKS
jgi:pseudaminic acid biosynthesis-associated methylase